MLEKCIRLVCAAALCGLVTLAHAGSIDLLGATLMQTDEGTVLKAEYSIDLGERLEEALNKGVGLSFKLELELTHPRWWWANEAVITRTVNYRLTHNALTQQYRLTTGSLHQNYATLSELLRVLSRTRLLVADKGQLKIGDSYAVGLRMSLDRSQLPKPFQIDAIANRDWQLESRVHRWNYMPQAAVVSLPLSTEARP